MTPEEINREIDSAEGYLMSSRLPEDTKDNERAFLRVARSGDERGLMVMLATREVRARVREQERMHCIAVDAASVAIAAHVVECAARKARSEPTSKVGKWARDVEPVAWPVCVSVSVALIAGVSLPSIVSALRAAFAGSM